MAPHKVVVNSDVLELRRVAVRPEHLLVAADERAKHFIWLIWYAMSSVFSRAAECLSSISVCGGAQGDFKCEACS